MNERSPYVEKLSRETGKGLEEIGKLWSKAKTITEETFGISVEKFTGREFEYAKENVYRMLRLDERFSISEFIKSDMSAQEFIEQAVQTSGDFSVSQGGQTSKKKAYKDDPDDPEKVKELEDEEEEEEEEEDDSKERQFRRNGTGPHGQGAGPGKGKADGTGMEEEKIFSGKYVPEGDAPIVKETLKNEEEEELSEELKEEMEDSNPHKD